MATDNPPDSINPWVPDFDTFAARLAGVRHRMGWNVKEAAVACSVAHTSWRDWEIHDRAPRDQVDVCRRISERTGVDFAWLLLGDVEVRARRNSTPSTF